MVELQLVSEAAIKQIEAAETPQALEEVRIEILGRKGRLAEISKAREAQESKRLLYVALTRAKNRLTLLLPRDKKLPRGSWGELISNLK